MEVAEQIASLVFKSLYSNITAEEAIETAPKKFYYCKKASRDSDASFEDPFHNCRREFSLYIWLKLVYEIGRPSHGCLVGLFSGNIVEEAFKKRGRN